MQEPQLERLSGMGSVLVRRKEQAGVRALVAVQPPQAHAPPQLHPEVAAVRSLDEGEAKTEKSLVTRVAPQAGHARVGSVALISRSNGSPHCGQRNW